MLCYFEEDTAVKRNDRFTCGSETPVIVGRADLFAIRERQVFCHLVCCQRKDIFETLCPK